MVVDSLQAPGEEQETRGEAPASTHDGGQGHGGGGGNGEADRFHVCSECGEHGFAARLGLRGNREK